LIVHVKSIVHDNVNIPFFVNSFNQDFLAMEKVCPSYLLEVGSSGAWGVRWKLRGTAWARAEAWPAWLRLAFVVGSDNISS
jgi:hypothetical protein